VGQARSQATLRVGARGAYVGLRGRGVDGRLARFGAGIRDSVGGGQVLGEAEFDEVPPDGACRWANCPLQGPVAK
jgi:hypothetical protein